MAEEKVPAGNAAGEIAIRRLSDVQLRKESKRRRLLTTGLSVTCSILSMLGAVWIQNNVPALYGFLFVAALFGINITIVLALFRWMAIPAKEAARRRKNSVLAMLGASPQSEP